MTREEREDAIDIIQSILNKYEEDECLVNEITIGDEDIKAFKMAIEALEQEPQTFKWCTSCREYDQEKHCCHRWSKVIRDTVAEMKQEYIEREVLDKIRAEIFEEMLSHSGTGEEVIQAYVDGLKKGLEIIDKYKTETEG